MPAGFKECPISFHDVSHTALRRMAGQADRSDWGWGSIGTGVGKSACDKLTGEELTVDAPFCFHSLGFLE